jgi:hypothetical protein
MQTNYSSHMKTNNITNISYNHGVYASTFDGSVQSYFKKLNDHIIVVINFDRYYQK